MSQVWLNGALLPGEAARIDPADRGFTLGDGLFETLRAENGEPLHVELHFARLRQGAAVLALPLPIEAEGLRAALRAVLRANDLAQAALRLTLSRGITSRGVLPVGDIRPTILIMAAGLPAALPPARLIIAQCTRRNEFSPLSRIKSLNYLDSILARQEASDAGADDAVLLNTRGHVAEATGANLCLYIDGHWRTPPVADGALPGIARARLLRESRVLEATVTPADMERAEAACLVNSLGRRLVRAVGAVELDADHPAFDGLGVG